MKKNRKIDLIKGASAITRSKIDFNSLKSTRVFADKKKRYISDNTKEIRAYQKGCY